MIEYLKGFSKRMELTAAVDSIINRANRNQEIERLFPPNELDNLILSVLVFIMEKTLAEEESCTIDAITDFIAAILPEYGKNMNRIEQDSLARYLIKDILQNKGDARLYAVMDYETGKRLFPVRLITDKLDEKNRILYELTKQGYDFLFRTKEVDDELGFQIETIRLRMLISKKNYKKALSQSQYIIAMLREKRNELLQFERQLRHDVYSVSGEEYSGLIGGVDSMLREEYETMGEIERVIDLAVAHLKEESRLRVSPDEKTAAAQREVFLISNNVRRALALQRDLLIRCESMRKLYLVQLRESIEFQQIKRFNFKEEILEPIEKLAGLDIAAADSLRKSLLLPLFLPELNHILNLSLAYDRQAKIKENAAEVLIEEEESLRDEHKQERVRTRNESHARIISLLLEFAENHAPRFSFGEFFESIREHKNLDEMTAERLLFLDMLKLYEIREIDFDKWREENAPAADCMGEFDLSYCLARCMNRVLSLKRMVIDKSGEDRVCCVTGDGERVYIHNLKFEVTLRETNG
ncbi:MAG: hypothetical protein LBS84_01705 [Clostridiales bacterium]|jgi:hypothetical protein|nr:hypothetical protein [Clostridiales bacterium]